MNRPSAKELSQKIRQAREAVRAGKIALVNPLSIAADAVNIGYLVADIQLLLRELLREIKTDSYAGHKPPQRSYEDRIKGCDLFAFQWKSTVLDCAVYFKFALHKGIFWLVSLHRDKVGRGDAG